MLRVVAGAESGVAYTVLICCAAPPFSTRSPSGESEALPTSAVAKGERKPQKAEAEVQKLVAVFATKPVLRLSAAVPLPSTSCSSLVVAFATPSL